MILVEFALVFCCGIITGWAMKTLFEAMKDDSL